MKSNSAETEVSRRDINLLMRHQLSESFVAAPIKNKTRNGIFLMTKAIMLSLKGPIFFKRFRDTIKEKYQVSFDTHNNLELAAAFIIALDEFLALPHEAQQARSSELLLMKFE